MGVMTKYSLPTSTEINGQVCEFRTDFRDILNIFAILNDPNLLQFERTICALENFYLDETYKSDINLATSQMFYFILMGEDDTANTPNQKPLFNWEQDFNLIVAPINRVLSMDIRGQQYVHWWTVLSAFYEIGECTFNTFITIRDKLNKGKKLEKYESRIFKENRNRILLKNPVDDTTQQYLDLILGKGG